MANTLTYPTTSPTITITFDGIVDIARGRTAMNSEDFGSTTGVSRQAASNRTKADIQITFILATIDGVSVRTKVSELAELYKLYASEDMKITVDFADGGTCIWIGKIVDERGTFDGGAGAVKYMGSFDMNVAQEIWS